MPDQTKDWYTMPYVLRRWWKWLTLAIFGLLLTPFVAWSAATLENPAPGAIKSGVGLVSGWVCDAEVLEVSFGGGPRTFVPYGSERTDTAGVCGDSDNGFGLLWNYNELGDGPHTIALYADGIVQTQVNFNVQTLGTSFLQGAVGQGTVSLSNDIAVHVQWEETTQGFAIVGYNTQIADESTGEVCNQEQADAKTECHQIQTRIDDLQEDMEYMQEVMDDVAAGCVMYEDKDMPGGYAARGVWEYSHADNIRYCLDKAVFNVGPCIEDERHIYAGSGGKITPSHLDGGDSSPYGSLHSSQPGSSVAIKHQTSNRAGDVGIALGPAENGAYFVDGGAWGPGDETITFYRVSIWHNNRGQGYVVRYDPETETSTLYGWSSSPIDDDVLAAYVSVYIREFFTRIEDIVDTGQIPRPPPLRCIETAR